MITPPAQTDLDPAELVQALAHTRAQFRAVLCRPLNTVLRTARALDHAQAVYALPMEAAAAGFELTICQGETGWRVALQRPVADGVVFEANADARSLTSALFQLSDRGLLALDHLDCQARTKPNSVKGRAV